jgi:hypothetical protein
MHVKRSKLSNRIIQLFAFAKKFSITDKDTSTCQIDFHTDFNLLSSQPASFHLGFELYHYVYMVLSEKHYFLGKH